MGLYSFVVLDEHGNPTGEEIEEIFKWNAVPDVLISSHGRTARRKGVEVIAKPADTSKFGVSGVFNRGLGCVVNDWRHYDQILAERGLIREADLPRHFFEERLEKSQQHYKEQDAQYDKEQEAKKTSGLDAAEEGTPEYAQAAERYWDIVLPSHEIWGSA